MATPTVRSVASELATFRDEVRARLGTLPRLTMATMTTVQQLATSPGVLPFNWLMGGLVLDMDPTPTPVKNLLSIPARALDEAARRCRTGEGLGYANTLLVADSPIGLDFEVPGDQPQVYVPANAKVLRGYLDRLRLTAPSSPLGLVGVDYLTPGGGIPGFAAGLATAEHRAYAKAYADGMRPAVAGCDFVCLSTMLGEPESAEVYTAAAVNGCRFLRDAYGLPVFAVLLPNYLYRKDGQVVPLSAVDAGRLVSEMRRVTDGVIVHPSGLTGDGPDWRHARAVYGDYI